MEAASSQRSAPERMTFLSARSPRSSEMVLMSTDLPAPVSPVITLKPSSNSTSAASIRARFFILTHWSMIFPGIYLK